MEENETSCSCTWLLFSSKLRSSRRFVSDNDYEDDGDVPGITEGFVPSEREENSIQR